MKTAPIPSNENLRQRDLESYGILDSEKEDDFNHLIELASQICDCPIALVTFIDNDRQWFKAAMEVDGTETTREVSFCSHTILQQEVMVVTDAKTDDRFHDNPFVTGPMNIGFYAGAPIVSSGGHNLGSVCVLDKTARHDFTDKQKEALKMIANQVSRLLDLRIKNKMIKKHADAQIAAEKKLAQVVVMESDKKDNYIAYELHENLAQSLAATKMFIESAAESKDLFDYFIDKSKESLHAAITEVKKLSKSITPTTFQNADYFWLMKDYATHFCDQNGINVKFGSTEVLQHAEVGPNLFRVLQHQLEISKNCHAKNIFISVRVGSKISFDVKDDGEANNSSRNTTHFTNISTRVDILKGELNKKSTVEGNFLQMKLPVAV